MARLKFVFVLKRNISNHIKTDLKYCAVCLTSDDNDDYNGDDYNDDGSGGGGGGGGDDDDDNDNADDAAADDIHEICFRKAKEIFCNTSSQTKLPLTCQMFAIKHLVIYALQF